MSLAYAGMAVHDTNWKTYCWDRMRNSHSHIDRAMYQMYQGLASAVCRQVQYRS
jgi:hypothetical protein